MSSQLINIAGIDMPVIEYHDQRVITLNMMDIVHKRPRGTAKRNFKQHQDKLLQNRDYEVLRDKDLSNFLVLFASDTTLITKSNNLTKIRSLVVLYKIGYLMIAKSFRTSPKITKLVCQKYFDDKSIMFLKTQSHEGEFGAFLKQSLEGLVVVKTQVAIQDYRVDFLLPEYGIVVEYDEEHHRTDANQIKDRERDEALSLLGYIVVRVDKREPYGMAINRILKVLLKR